MDGETQKFKDREMVPQTNIRAVGRGEELAGRILPAKSHGTEHHTPTPPL